NVRELDHAVERGVLMARGSAIEAQDLGLKQFSAPQRLEDMSLEEVESFLIQKTLQRCGQNVSQAALALGLSRGALYRRLEKFGIDLAPGRIGASRPA